jgi:uncharacterized protein (UPF0333 family)
MIKGNFSTLTDIIQGGGLPVSLGSALVTGINLDVMWEDIRPIDSPRIVADIGTQCQANIISNIHLIYGTEYDVYLTLVYSGEVMGYGLPSAEDIILSVKNNEFKFDYTHAAVTPVAASNHVISFNSKDAENSLSCFFEDRSKWLGVDSAWFDDEKSKVILNGYAESLNLKVNPIYNCFDKSLREQIDASIRESAIELMRQPPKY